MNKEETIIIDLTIFAMKQIQLAKADRELTGDHDYWTGEMQSMKYLLLHLDKLLGDKKRNDTELPDLVKLFEAADAKRKAQFDFLWARIWEDAIPED